MPQVEQFGKYILLEKLATGGMAEVYLAKSTGANGVNKILAIKRILPQFSENREFIDMFKEEAKIAVNLNHSNVVSIFDFGIEKKQFFLVMEHVEGKNLRQIINELKRVSVSFTIEQVAYMIKEVAAGLDHAHRCIDGSTGRPLNITHRDMSPQNIMLSFDGEVKIIDFGIAKAETQLEVTKAGTLKGKFGYMSPEQAEGQAVDLRTDIFSLGIVVWELLANDRLFTASSEAAILRKIRDCQIPSIRKINPSIPPELERIVNKALQKDKNLRYQTSAAMHRDLNRFLNTQYPEFTPNDFSVFIKNTFATAYQEQKRKLIEFSKVKPEEVTNITRTSRAETDISQQEYMEGLEEFNPPDSFDLKAGTKVTLTDLRTNGDRKGSTRIRHGTATGITAGTKTRQLRSAGKRGQKTLILKNISHVLPAVFRSLAFILICASSIYVYRSIPGHYFHAGYWLEKIKRATIQQASSEAQPGDMETASKAEYFVTIHSNPMGAEIFVDGKRQGFTPGQFRVEGKKSFHITLVKDRYLPYERDMIADNDAVTYSATMLPLPRAGYLTINVVAGGDNPMIEINGQRLGEKPPITNYPIPAGIPVVVRAHNPFSDTFAEQSVTIQSNQKKTIELILRRDDRTLQR